MAQVTLYSTVPDLRELSFRGGVLPFENGVAVCDEDEAAAWLGAFPQVVCSEAPLEVVAQPDVNVSEAGVSEAPAPTRRKP